MQPVSHMKSLIRKFFPLAALIWSAVGSAHLACAADVGLTGTINNVPGYPPGTKLDYTVGATKTAPKTVNFWIYLKNNNNFEIKIVLCSMLNLKNKPLVSCPLYTVAKDANGVWVCQLAGQTMAAPNYHQSCVNVTIPANGIANPFDTKNVFSTDFAQEDLASVYFDVLKDCPIQGCAQVMGPDKFLVPLAPTAHSDWVNVWAHNSGMGSSTLVPGGFASWASGNWVTMGFPNRYPSRLVGRIINAPVGSSVHFGFAGQPGLALEVPPCPNCPEGISTLVDVNAPFDITDNPLAEDDIGIAATLEAVRALPEGYRVEFHGEVIAEAGAPFYEEGQFMYGIDAVFTKDTQPPVIHTQSIAQVGSAAFVRVYAADGTTMATGASLVWQEPSGTVHTRGLEFAIPATSGELMVWEELITDLPVGVPLKYHFDVFDVAGNRASGGEQTITLRPRVLTSGECTALPGLEFPGVGNSGRIADDGSGSNCVIHLTDAGRANSFGVLAINQPSLARRADTIHLSWKSLIGGDDGTACNVIQYGRPGADGYSVSWGTDLPNPPSYGNPGEEGAGNGLVVNLDTYDNGNREAPGIEIKWRGTRVAFDPISPDPTTAKDFLRKGIFVKADLTVDESGHVSFNYDGRLMTTQLAGWTGLPGATIQFGARTGSACDNHWLDDLIVEPYCKPPSGNPFPGVGNVAYYGPDHAGERCVVHLTDQGLSSAFGVWALPDPFPAEASRSIRMRWESLIGGDRGSPPCEVLQFGNPGADGYSVNWAADLPVPPAYGNPGEEGAGNGLTVSVDTFDNGGSEAPGIEIKWKGSRIAFDNIHPNPELAKNFLRKGVFVDAELLVETNGIVTFTYDERVLRAILPDWNGLPGGRIMFGARTGGACDNHWIAGLTIDSGLQQECGEDLRVTQTGNKITVRWSGDGFLVASPTLAQPSWETVSGNTQGIFETEAAGTARYFRVFCPPELIGGAAAASELDPRTIALAIPIVNPGIVTAERVLITSMTFGGVPVTAPLLPSGLGSVSPKGSVIFQAQSEAIQLERGVSHPLIVAGTFTVGNKLLPFTISTQALLPRQSPGEAPLNTATVTPAKVSGAPYPPHTTTFGPRVNPGAPPVPDGLPNQGAPNSAETKGVRIQDAERAADVGLAGPTSGIAFFRNNGTGLPSGGVNGTVSTTAEPSGASSTNVVFVAANWAAGFSTDGGVTFTTLDPMTIFPNDAVGFCCDQIVQYVPNIDLFVWLLQGNGYRLAVASPADIIRSGGTAWTYWNLTPGVFGACSGFDYPDLSVGDNSLYLSWDAGFGGCTSGFQVVRTSLAGLAAGGTITLEFTDPALGTMAWGSHVMQNTLNEVFWAGHNNSSSIRVFSLAEGSGVYSWRDVGVGSWANNSPTSIVPDNQDWLAKNFNGPGGNSFPRNGIIGATRSGNELWFAWTAGTNSAFPQAHVELVTFDLNRNFSLIRQVQIWNSSYAFGYPALATDPCAGEIGLSLEYGGGGNYQNHVVGYWGDFVVYITSGSNVGTSRFGDYVSLRQAPGLRPGSRSILAAFGYGLNAAIPPATGTLTDIRYVLFGRMTTDCP
jgi:hypothetical protein